MYATRHSGASFEQSFPAELPAPVLRFRAEVGIESPVTATLYIRSTNRNVGELSVLIKLFTKST